MNTTKLQLQKAVGIINLVLGILETLGGLLIACLSGIVVEIIEETAGSSVATSAMTAVLIVAGLIAMGIGIVMIILSTKLIKEPKVLPDGRVDERKGIVIFFIVIGIIMAIGSISALFSGNFLSLITLLAFVASVVLAFMSLSQRHNETYNQYGNNWQQPADTQNGPYDPWGNNNGNNDQNNNF